MTFLLFLYVVITIGFNPAAYTVAESVGSVNVTVSILNGTLARDVHVLLMTGLTNGTATGIYTVAESWNFTVKYLSMQNSWCHFSYMQLQWTMWSLIVT